MARERFVEIPIRSQAYNLKLEDNLGKPFWRHYFRQAAMLRHPKFSIPLDWIDRLVPTFHAAAQNSYVLATLVREHFRRACRALLSSSNSYYRPLLDVSQL